MLDRRRTASTSSPSTLSDQTGHSAPLPFNLRAPSTQRGGHYHRTQRIQATSRKRRKLGVCTGVISPTIRYSRHGRKTYLACQPPSTRRNRTRSAPGFPAWQCVVKFDEARSATPSPSLMLGKPLASCPSLLLSLARSTTAIPVLAAARPYRLVFASQLHRPP